ncbi:MAG: S8 family serine peptidase, partial [Nanoarchaeota archaeon]
MKAGAFWNSGYTGNGTKVAVLDTGIDKNHPMLQGKVVAEKDFSKSGNTDDKYGHGTHVAGIIAGTTANGGKYSGVAPNAQLLNAKVIGDDGTGDNVDIIAGIGWALDPDSNPSTDDGAKVISMSLGAPKALDTSIDSAIKDAVAKGAVVVVSSGNCGSGCPSVKCGSFRGVTSPGNSPSVISVGAVDKSKSVACFSSGESISGVGIKPDFVAPGVGVKSSVPGGSYQAMDGTSMAAPHVSGAIALMLSKNSALKQEDVKSVLEKTSLDLGDIGKDTSYGFGLIDLAKALIYREGLEFSVGLQRQILSGSLQKINVTVYDDVQVNSVNATITKPNGAKSAEVAFTNIGNNLYTYDYTDTALMGNYVVDVAVNYGGVSGSSGAGSEGGGEAGSGSGGSSSITITRTAYFKVTSLTGDFGNVEDLNISEKQKLSKNITGNLTFANTAAVELNFSALLQLLRVNNGSPEAKASQEIRLPAATIAAGAKATVAVNNAL